MALVKCARPGCMYEAGVAFQAARRNGSPKIRYAVPIGRNCALHAEKEVVFDPVRRDSKLQTFSPNSFGRVADKIPVWSHLHRGPVAQPDIVHGKAIVMLASPLVGTGETSHVSRNIRALGTPADPEKVRQVRAILRSVEKHLHEGPRDRRSLRSASL